MVPQPINPHEMHTVEDMEKHHPKNKKLMRMGLFTGLAVGIHNFPEGLATFIAALNDPALWHCHCPGYRAAQHSRRHSRLCPHILRHRQPPQGLRLLFFVRPGRAGGRAYRLYPAASLYERHDLRYSLCSSGRNNGIHFSGRTAAGIQRIW